MRNISKLFISINLISALTNKGAFPVDEIQKIQLLFFSIYRFKVIIDVILQQEHDTLKNWRNIQRKHGLL